jgi:hypothetical protein
MHLTLSASLVALLGLIVAIGCLSEQLGVSRDVPLIALAVLATVLHFGESLALGVNGSGVLPVQASLGALAFRLLSGAAAYGFLLTAVYRAGRALPLEHQGEDPDAAGRWRTAASGLDVLAITAMMRLFVAAATVAAVILGDLVHSNSLVYLAMSLSPIGGALCASLHVTGLARLRATPQPSGMRAYVGFALGAGVLSVALEFSRLMIAGDSEPLPNAAELALIDLLRQGAWLISLQLTVAAISGLATHLGEVALAKRINKLHGAIAFLLITVSLFALDTTRDLPQVLEHLLVLAVVAVLAVTMKQLAGIARQLGSALRSRTSRGVPPPLAQVVADS